MLRLDLHVHNRHTEDSQAPTPTAPIPLMARQSQKGFAKLRKALR